MDRIEAALERLAQAQARSAERFSQVEVALARLAEAQACTEEHITRIEEILERTERVLAELTTQVKALSDNAGYGLEDIARVVLPGYLRSRYGIQIERLERRIFQVDGQSIDIDLYAEGKRGRKQVVVLGEVKARIYGREVSQFHSTVERLMPLIAAEIVPLMFGYFIDLSAMEAAGQQTLLIASYQPTTEMPSRQRRRSRR